MKIVATLVLLLALSLSAAYRKELELELSSPEVQEYMNELIEDDFEIIDVDDALHKARILKAMAHLIDEAEAMDVRHPRKRFIESVFKRLAAKIRSYINKTWNTAKKIFNKLMPAYDKFNDVIDKLIGYLHIGESLTDCEATVLKKPKAILGDAAKHKDIVTKPLCEAALAKLAD